MGNQCQSVKRLQCNSDALTASRWLQRALQGVLSLILVRFRRYSERGQICRADVFAPAAAAARRRIQWTACTQEIVRRFAGQLVIAAPSVARLVRGRRGRAARQLSPTESCSRRRSAAFPSAEGRAIRRRCRPAASSAAAARLLGPPCSTQVSSVRRRHLLSVSRFHRLPSTLDGCRALAMQASQH